MSHNKKYKKNKSKCKEFISSTLDATEKKMIADETFGDYWDTYGMKIKPWEENYVIVGKTIETEPIKINNSSDNYKLERKNNE